MTEHEAQAINGRLDKLVTAQGKTSKAVTTLVEKMKHPCEAHGKMDRRITRLEVLKEGLRNIILIWVAVGGVLIAAASLFVNALK